MASQLQHVDYDLLRHSNWTWLLNGKRVSRDSAADLSERYENEWSNPFQEEWAPHRTCPFCASTIESAEFNKRVATSTDWDDPACCYRLASCNYCCYWSLHCFEGTDACMDAPNIVKATSIARKFDDPLPYGCSEELALQLRRNASLWHSIEPTQMERLVADIFRANYRDAEVMHVGKPGDLGIDVLFVDAGKQDWLIQVKRRESSESVEGFDTLQRLLGTLVLEGKVRGIIATTAKKFSRQLLKQKRRAESRGYTIELLDRGKLNRMLNPMLPSRPWLEVLKSDLFWGFDDEIRGHFIERTTAAAPCLF